MRNVHLKTEYVVLFRNQRDKSQFGHLASQLEPKHSKALVDAYVDATSRPYSYILVDLKSHTPDALRYRSNSLQLDRQTLYVIGAVPTRATRRPPPWKNTMQIAFKKNESKVACVIYIYIYI